jgi:hypothetical protein
MNVFITLALQLTDMVKQHKKDMRKKQKELRKKQKQEEMAGFLDESSQMSDVRIHVKELSTGERRFRRKCCGQNIVGKILASLKV